MTMATRTDTQSPELHVADRHDLIRVHGARVNNLKDVSVEIPKRQLTVFTGVSGSGKSSLVFGTIAAESQRLINETYSAFVQGFMPALARPEVDVLEGLTTAIVVDQQRIGADPRSTVGTATDANAMLRILFSRLGQPHIGSPQAFSFNVASISGAGAVNFERGGKTVKERRSFSITGGMCPRCEGRGTVSDVDLTQLFDDSKSRLHGGQLLRRETIPGVGHPGPGQADPQVHQERANRLPAPRADQGEGQRGQRHLRGADPQDPAVDARQGRRHSAAAYPRVRGPGGHVHHLP
jgi:energy-coupling factor transporter ATP-binding protein EcfA2